MDFSLIGQKIREVRLQLGMSQKEVCAGICSQAQISKIEKGEVYPSAPTLYQITKRLGLDLNYFFEGGITQRQDYVDEVKSQLKAARRNEDYQLIKDLVRAELSNPIFMNNQENRQFLLWHKGIFEYKLDKNTDKALGTLKQALAITHKKDNIWTETELAIVISIGSIYSGENRLDEAIEVFRKTLAYVTNKMNIESQSILPSLCFNYSNALTCASHYEESIQCCRQAIEWLIQHDNMFLLGELHYNIGYNYEFMGQAREAFRYYEKAVRIFTLQKQTRQIPYIREKMERLQNEAGPHSTGGTGS
ncbi:helix-turn-helix domain-containing protein [Peribacillus kribbensis]|uniref:helix-turn-helix domain-containing protein n=1 Tax=Peribacillus kribbensis TaxID=356658 RepID=UPI00047ADA69|nr:helix-turn-helix domain-containing protein [Peribacillus kribbensis]